jgi:glycosyltransferase involved in cell wall biosynthesis
MKICIDARWIKEKIAGIGRYTVYLLKYLAELDRRNSYEVLFHRESIREKVWGELDLDAHSNFASMLVPYDVFSMRGQLSLPHLLRREEIDLFHSTNFMAPLKGFGGKLLITIHDIIPLKFPEYAPRSKKTRLFLFYRGLMKWLVTIADGIIADSEHSRRDILEFFNISPRKVHTVYLGVDAKYRPLPTDAKEEVRRSLNVKDRLVLFAGRADPYKNLISLVKAVDALNRAGKVHCTIAVAGERDPRYREVERYIMAKRMQGEVLFPGSLDEDALIRLYNAADVLVLPSFYEGFGLPPLEAMACGTPVVCSRSSSLPEVVGNAALMTEPTNVKAIALAIERICTDDGLRNKLIGEGLKRAVLFPWRATAEKTLLLYQRMVKSVE